MSRVLSKAIAHPTRPVTVSTVRHGWAVTRQTSCVIGYQPTNRAIRQTLEARTYVDRSELGGTIRVNQCLKPDLAMTLCWTPNSASNATSTTSAATVRLPL